MTSEIDPVTNLLCVIGIIFFALIFLIQLVVQIKRFLWELDYINCEIARTTGAERRYWQKKKRRLWLSFLPFYR